MLSFQYDVRWAQVDRINEKMSILHWEISQFVVTVRLRLQIHVIVDITVRIQVPSKV